MDLFSEKLFSKVPVIGILRGYPKQDVLDIAQIYYETGFTNLEVTMNTPDARKIIHDLVHSFGGKLNIGAGTVCSIEDLDHAIGAGSQFVVTPILSHEIMEKCSEKGIPVFPGAFTPTEIYQAWDAGARMVKVFPASLMGPKYIKEVLAPLDEVELMPTGGIGFNNMDDYVSAGAKAFGMGGFLFDRALIKSKDWKGFKNTLIIKRIQIVACFNNQDGSEIKK